MTYGTIAALRKLSGGITISTLSDPEMTEFLEYGDEMIQGCTGLIGLTASDPRFNMMVQGALYYASSAVRDHLKDVDKMADTHYNRAKSICENIINFNTSGGVSTSITSVSQGYESYPLNKEGKIIGYNGYININNENTD